MEKYIIVTLPVHRSGWTGAWDAIRAAFTKSKRVSFAQEVKIKCAFSDSMGGCVTLTADIAGE